MIATVLERAIQGMCSELRPSSDNSNWRCKSESQLLSEAAICIVGSQMAYEMALAIVRQLGMRNLLEPYSPPNKIWKRHVAQALGTPVQYVVGGHRHSRKPRFKNRIAYLLARTLGNVYGLGNSFHKMLSEASGAEDARRTLVSCVYGFGPKQASLFLRRVGFSADLAVIDTHVLDCLRICLGVSIQPAALSRLGYYEEMEETFKVFAAKIGYEVGCVDLATWVTMRVAKKEAYI